MKFSPYLHAAGLQGTCAVFTEPDNILYTFDLPDSDTWVNAVVNFSDIISDYVVGDMSEWNRLAGNNTSGELLPNGLVMNKFQMKSEFYASCLPPNLWIWCDESMDGHTLDQILIFQQDPQMELVGIMHDDVTYVHEVRKLREKAKGLIEFEYQGDILLYDPESEVRSVIYQDDSDFYFSDSD